jgi:hypothetical protein
VLGLGHVIPTSRYDLYRLDGMLSSLTPQEKGIDGSSPRGEGVR